MPIRIPARLLRLCILAQVTIRSPIPDKPENVAKSAPIARPSRVISAIPLVISAALVLSPYPKPSAIPAASAITFFNAPPIHIPRTSGLMYTRNTLLINIFCKYSASFLLAVPITQVVGIPLPTSSAWLGPDNTATTACGISSFVTSHNVFKDSSSIHLPTLTIYCPSLTYGATILAVDLV